MIPLAADAVAVVAAYRPEWMVPLASGAAAAAVLDRLIAR